MVPYNHYTHLIVSCVFPLVIAGMIGLSYLSLKDGADKAEATSRHANAFLLLTFLVLPSTSMSIMRTFHCESIESAGSWLIADYALECDTSKHGAHSLFAGFMMAVYPIGIPALYFVLLYRHKGLINPPAEDVGSALRTRDGSEALKPISFLFKYYKPSCWYFEVLESLRRVLLTGGIIFFGTGALRAAVGLVVALLTVIVYREVSPYLAESVNSLSTAATWQLSFTFVGGVIILGRPFGYADTVLGLILIALNVVVIVLAIVLQLRSGSAALEAELKMMELAFRQAELELSATEMRSIISSLTGQDGDEVETTNDDAPRTLSCVASFGGAHTASSGGHTAHKPVRSTHTAVIKKIDGGGGKKLEITFDKAHFPCYVVSLSKLRKLTRIINHEEARQGAMLDELTQTSRSPSCAFSFFVSQNWESRDSPDNAENTKLRWLQNLPKHLGHAGNDPNFECWIWWDFCSVPQNNRALQACAIASLCNYASLCSRVVPLVRDGAAFRELHGARSAGAATLPSGTYDVYMRRGWCNLELIAALCPKRFASSGQFRPGPVNLRIRYHHDPSDYGCGPALGIQNLRDPRAANYTNPDDVQMVEPVLERIAEEYAAYEASGSRAWAATLDVSRRPTWLKQLAQDSDESTAAGDAASLEDRTSNLDDGASASIEVISVTGGLPLVAKKQLSGSGESARRVSPCK